MIPLDEIQRLESAEMGVLGSMILSEGALAECLDLVDAADFLSGANRAVFESLARLGASGGIDVVLLRDDLASRGRLDEAGGMNRLIKLAEFVPSPKNARFYARIVSEGAFVRRAEGAAAGIAEAVRSADRSMEGWTDALRAECEASVARIGAPGREDSPDFEAACHAAMARVDAAMDGVAPGLATGLPSLDAILGGLRGKRLYVVGARPGMGKTALKLRMIDAAATAGGGVFAVSLEMGADELSHRLACARSGIGIEVADRPGLSIDDYNRYSRGQDSIYRLPIHIEGAGDRHDRTGPRSWTMDRVRLGALKARRRFEARGVTLSLVTIDYFQLLRADIRGHGNNDQLALESMSAACKSLAMELDVPVLLLSQLGRDVDRREDKRPILPDLRSTGALEQDADIVLFPFRQSYYTEKAKGREEEGIVPAEIIVAKHRSGRTGTARTSFEPGIARFEDARGWS